MEALTLQLTTARASRLTTTNDELPRKCDTVPMCGRQRWQPAWLQAAAAARAGASPSPQRSTTRPRGSAAPSRPPLFPRRAVPAPAAGGAR